MKKFDELLSNNLFVALLLAAASCAAVSPLIFFGVYQGVDLSHHYQLASVYHEAIGAGDFYPRWGRSENLGYGGLGVRFYPPVVPFLLAAARIATGDWHTATWTFFLAFTFLGGLGVYFWAKEFLPAKTAFWAGVLFVFMPFHLSDIMSNAVFAEYAGCSTLAFSFLFVTRICRRGNLTNVLGLSLSFAALVLTHLPLTIIGSFSLALYALVLSKKVFFATAGKLAAGAALALAATSFFWVIIVTEKSWLRGNRFNTDIYSDYSFNFLLTTAWFDERMLCFFNGLLLATVFLVFVFYGVLRRGEKLIPPSDMRAVAILFWFSILMTLVLSKPLWSIAPLLREVQFPWRWLNVTALCAPVLTAAGTNAFWRLMKTSWQKLSPTNLLPVAAVVCFVAALGAVYASFPPNYLPANQINEWVAIEARSRGLDFWWTKDGRAEMFEIKQKVIAVGRETEITNWQPYNRAFTVKAGEPTAARLATLYYPHWRATVNNQPTNLQIGSDGAMTLFLPPEAATVEIEFQEPRHVGTAALVSLLTWLALGAAGLFLFFAKMRDGCSRFK